jgi:hypothetical protein
VVRAGVELLRLRLGANQRRPGGIEAEVVEDAARWAMKAMICIRPPHAGHARTSSAKTFLSSSAQATR